MAGCEQMGRRGQFRNRVAYITVAGISGVCAGKALTHAFDALERLAVLTDAGDPASDLSRIAAADTADTVQLHPWTWHLIKAANEVAYRSDGLFDAVMLGSGGRARWTDLDLSMPGQVRPRRRLAVDPSGLIKGFAADIALQALKDFGAPAGLVDIGGRVAAFGPAAWRISFHRCARCTESGKAENLPLELRDSAARAPKNYDRSMLLDTERGQFVSGLELAEGMHLVRADTATVADAVAKVVALRPECKAKMPALFGATVSTLSARPASVRPFNFADRMGR